MKIECEIDWVDEEDSIDETIKSAIIEKASNKTVNRLVARIVDGGYDALEKRASAALGTHIDDLMVKLTERFMDKEIIVTDNWGDVQEKHESVNELLKSKFDEFMTQSVDSKGKPTTSCSYGKSRTRVEYLIDESIRAFSHTMSKDISAEMDKKLEEKKALFMAEAGARMAEKLGLAKDPS